MLSPEFGPKIPVEEALEGDRSNFGQRHFRCWTVRLVSMTLLVPLILPPNYGNSGPPYWEAKTISFPNMDGLGGMQAELDCGLLLYVLCSASESLTNGVLAASARTYVPISVYNDIRSSWLHQPNNMPGSLRPGWAQDTFLSDANSFQDHDIIFKFKGTGDNEVEFRCSAEHFLVSPWFVPGKEVFTVPFKAVRPPQYDEPQAATLGMVSIPCQHK